MEKLPQLTPQQFDALTHVYFAISPIFEEHPRIRVFSDREAAAKYIQASRANSNQRSSSLLFSDREEEAKYIQACRANSNDERLWLIRCPINITGYLMPMPLCPSEPYWIYFIWYGFRQLDDPTNTFQDLGCYNYDYRHVANEVYKMKTRNPIFKDLQIFRVKLDDIASCPELVKPNRESFKNLVKNDPSY